MSSEEILSSFASPGEGNFGYYKQLPEWLILGGDIRSVYFGSESSEENTFIPMEKSVEAGVTYRGISAVGSIGLYNDRDIESRKRYLAFQPTEWLSFKTGKFLPSYGIKFPDHTIFSRGPLGLGEGSESYNNELVLKSKWGELFLTAIDRTKDEFGKYTTAGRGYAGRLSAYPTNFTIIGANFTKQEEEMKCGGFFEIAGHGFFAATDTNEVWHKDTELADLFSYNRVQYQLFKGLNIIYENNYKHVSNISSRQNSIGLSAYPRPHFELYTKLFQQNDLYVKQLGFLAMGHYYL